MNSVLIIEDEIDICDAIRYALEKEGYKVHSSNDGIRGFFLALKVRPDIIVLDLMLPGMNGVEVCRKIKSDPKTSSIPVIIISARASETDKIGGFEIGADDYVTKPFSIRELIARIKAVSKRSFVQKGKDNSIIRCKDLEIDPAGHNVYVSGDPIELSLKEFKLLQVLVQNKGVVLKRKDILREVWNIEADIETRTVDVHITRIRQKLEKSSCRIDTVHGVGYRLRAI